MLLDSGTGDMQKILHYWLAGTGFSQRLLAPVSRSTNAVFSKPPAGLLELFSDEPRDNLDHSLAGSMRVMIM